MTEIVSSLTSAFSLAFVITSMFSLGLGMTVKDIFEPLKNLRLVGMALLANFVIVPVVAYVLTRVFSLPEDLGIGVLLMSTVAGAPLTIKATQISRGDMRFAGALVILQVMVTVVYLPFVLPLLFPGIEVDTVAIAMPLIVQILLPLAAGLLMNYRYDEEAEMTRPIMGEIANISLALMIVLNLVNVGDILGLLGTGAILTVLLVLAAAFVVGYLVGGPEAKTKRVLSIGTAQRNYAAAFVLAMSDFADRPSVFLLLLAASLISMILVMVVAGEFGRRAKAQEVLASTPV
jgi:predicted Na+-dependent transporter